jgi:hypothetical protein
MVPNITGYIVTFSVNGVQRVSVDAFNNSTCSNAGRVQGPGRSVVDQEVLQLFRVSFEKLVYDVRVERLRVNGRQESYVLSC